MKKPVNKIIALLISAALLAGCSSTVKETDTDSESSASSQSGTLSESTASSVSEDTIVSDSSSESSVTSSSAVSEVASSESTASDSSSDAQSNPANEPHFSFVSEPQLEIPSGEAIPICSLSEALADFQNIANRTPEGTPEQIVKTLLERNILVFAAMQGKCWTTDSQSSNKVVPIKSDYLTSVEQITDLVYGTYTENQSWRLFHPQEVGGYGDVFQYDNDGNLCFDMYHLRKNNGGSFGTRTYAAVIESSDTEITFGRYYESEPTGNTAEPNNMHFKAVNENGDWRLEIYITDAPAFAPLYSELIPTGRVGAPELMELAKQQVGNIGGEKYWKWYGSAVHFEWCAAFVSWCYAQAGKDGPFFTGCYTGAEWFREHDQWGERGYPDIAPGDSIFIDWNGDGSEDHVGLVIGTDGSYVYTVEGNRDDICVTKGYPLNSQYIAGYGLMNWDDV